MLQLVAVLFVGLATGAPAPAPDQTQESDASAGGWTAVEALERTSGNAESALFQRSGAVELLTSGSFPKTVYDGSKASFVVFFAPWCGHCQHFAPMFSDFATKSKWGESVRMGAVDCVAESDLCNQFGIHSFPKLKFFQRDGHGEDYTANRTMEDMHNWVLTNTQVDVPVLHSQGQLNRLAKGSKPVALVLGDGKGDELTKAKDLALEFRGRAEVALLPKSLQHSSVELSRGEAQRDSKLMVGVGGNTAKGLQWKSMDQASPSYSDFVSKFVPAAKKFHSSAPQTMQDVVMKDWLPTPVPMQDLESAVRFGLQYGVLNTAGSNFGLEPEMYAALSNWVGLLKRQFPLAENRKKFADLEQLLIESPSVKESQPKPDLSLRDASIAFDKWKGFNFSAPMHWSYCGRQFEELRGYPCSLWLLFHTLTFNSKDETASSTVSGIRGYVKHFFGCQECKEHFLAATEGDEKRVNTREDAVMWLWRIHNQVNKRLAKESNGVLANKKVFPTTKDCTLCWNGEREEREKRAPVLQLLSKVYCQPNDSFTCNVGTSEDAGNHETALESRPHARFGAAWKPFGKLTVADLESDFNSLADESASSPAGPNDNAFKMPMIFL